MKTNKSLTKRVKISKKGKLLARKKGHGHFNAKAKREKQLKQKGLETITIKKKTLNQLVPNKQNG
tara:strand:- start:23646 stop:23840 length:195 start_codon:yes stop_codon:yes gene_type:complete